MKRIYLVIAFLMVGKFTFADSTFLPGLEFHYLYKENPFIFGTSETGVSEDEYVEFLISEENPLGEKIALISAFAYYLEWPDDHDENYFETYTAAFKKRVEEVCQTPFSTEIQLLITLMEDYQTMAPDTDVYERLADEIGNSLAAESVKVIAYAYDILYNRRWDRIEKYQTEYLEPYKNSWESYRQDVVPAIHIRVTEGWLVYIHQLLVEDLVEAAGTVAEEDSLYAGDDLSPEVHTYHENGLTTVLATKLTGENFSKTVSGMNRLDSRSMKIEYRWIPEKEDWREWTKTETTYDLEEKLVIELSYSWNTDTQDWRVERKTEMEYTYDPSGNILFTKAREYKWQDEAWMEGRRIELRTDGRRTWKVYGKDENAEFIRPSEIPDR